MIKAYDGVDPVETITTSVTLVAADSGKVFFIATDSLVITLPSTVAGVRYTFVKLSRKIGLRAPHDNHGPRLHDLRHTFAVKTLLKWYQTGVDVECHMPELATYLGHTHVNDTYWYISAVPELLRLATMRLDTIYGGKLS